VVAVSTSAAMAGDTPDWTRGPPISPSPVCKRGGFRGAYARACRVSA
jgi:hypothetical protein